MKFVTLLGTAALLVLGNAATVSAQTVSQPGQLGTSFQLQSGTNLDAYSASAVAKTSVATAADSHERFANRLWIASLLSAAAATSLDAASSWGKQEANGALASPNGQFGSKGVALKAGLAAALIIPQICLRKHKDLRTAFTVANFAEGAIYTGISMHNFQVRSAGAQQ